MSAKRSAYQRRGKKFRKPQTKIGDGETKLGNGGNAFLPYLFSSDKGETKKGKGETHFRKGETKKGKGENWFLPSQTKFQKGETKKGRLPIPP